MYRGEQVFLYKRAQILAGDLWAAYGRRGADDPQGLGFGDIDELTTFADYRVPQLLSAPRVGVMRYSDELRARIDAKAVSYTHLTLPTTPYV